LRGVFPEESTVEGVASKRPEDISMALLNRFMAFFDCARGASVDELPVRISESWGFSSSSWIRADVPGTLQDLVNSSPETKFIAISDSFEGFSLDSDDELVRHSGHPTYWFSLTNEFER